MNLRKIALGLLFGGALAIGSVACDDSSSSSGSTGDGGGGATIPTACATIGSDPDSAMTPFVSITSLSLPANDGFNIDGINNAARGGAGGGSGRTIAGCDEQDIAYGKDNSLAKVAAALATTIDLNAALDETVQPGTGTLLIEAQLNKLTTADVATDPCVGATIRVTPAGGTATTYTGSGSMTDHVASLAFGDFLSFTVALTVPAESCDGPCQPASLTIRVDKPVASVTLNATNTAIEVGSIIGGFIFFEDTTGTAGYDNATGFKTALLQYTSDVHLLASLEDTAVGAFDGARDLHMNPDRTIAPCTAPGGSAALVNRNSVSVALAIDSH